MTKVLNEWCLFVSLHCCPIIEPLTDGYVDPAPARPSQPGLTSAPPPDQREWAVPGLHTLVTNSCCCDPNSESWSQSTQPYFSQHNQGFRIVDIMNNQYDSFSYQNQQGILFFHWLTCKCWSQGIAINASRYNKALNFDFYQTFFTAWFTLDY